MPFLRNCWYVAAWDDEVAAGTTFHRRILDIDVLLVRDADDVVHAMRNRCPHRFAPLHMGELTDSGIECPYHGLQFDFGGHCIHNPHGEGNIPPNAKVRSFPLVARHMLLWIWMGDPAQADPAAIPPIVFHDPDRYAINKGYMHTATQYEYMTDNIMDLGHIEYLHKGILGSDAISRAEVDVTQKGNVVHSRRLARDEILPPGLEIVFQSGGEPRDRWLDVTWYPPGNMTLDVGVTEAGAPERIGLRTPGAHLMTPESEGSTHYFWSNCRDFRTAEQELHVELQAGLEQAFEFQDKPMVLAQRDAIDGEDFWEMQPVILAGDAGAIRARRILRKLIREESFDSKAA